MLKRMFFAVSPYKIPNIETVYNCMPFPYSDASLQKIQNTFLVFYEPKSKYRNCIQLQVVCVFGCSIAKHMIGVLSRLIQICVQGCSIVICMFFGVLLHKIQVRKLATILCSFRIRVFNSRAHVFRCFTNYIPNTETEHRLRSFSYSYAAL